MVGLESVEGVEDRVCSVADERVGERGDVRRVFGRALVAAGWAWSIPGERAPRIRVLRSTFSVSRDLIVV
jgi:hypothetical protein